MNKKGFGLVEWLLVAVVVIGLGIGGWYVWSENRDTQSSIATNDIATESLDPMIETYEINEEQGDTVDEDKKDTGTETATQRLESCSRGDFKTRKDLNMYPAEAIIDCRSKNANGQIYIKQWDVTIPNHPEGKISYTYSSITPSGKSFIEFTHPECLNDDNGLGVGITRFSSRKDVSDSDRSYYEHGKLNFDKVSYPLYIGGGAPGVCMEDDVYNSLVLWDTSWMSDAIVFERW